MDRELRLEQAGSAAAIQSVIDEVGVAGGGRVLLPEMDLELDRGLALRSGVTLEGRGEGTVLRKGPGRVYPLLGYHNWGMKDVPMPDTSGFAVGMTVSVHDQRTHGGFGETFATITWVADGWLGLDRGIETDYREQPELTTAYPLVFGLFVRDAAVRRLRLLGNRAQQDSPMGSCRGGAVYFGNCRGIEITEIDERDYHGEGLSFQSCADVTVKDCRFSDNTGNGLHPGAGSTNARFEGCQGHGNGKSGFYFCVRANRMTLSGCAFTGNEFGVSIGTRDSHNLIERCRMQDNRRHGLIVRNAMGGGTQAHDNHVHDCEIAGNTEVNGPAPAQVWLRKGCHGIVIDGCRIAGPGAGIGIHADHGVRGVYLADNDFQALKREHHLPDGALLAERPKLDGGYGSAEPTHYRHLPLPQS